MVQSVVSGVLVVIMVIDLHKGVWWEEEQERKRGGRRVMMDASLHGSEAVKRGEHDKAYRNGRSSGKHSSPHVYWLPMADLPISAYMN